MLDLALQQGDDALCFYYLGLLENSQGQTTQAEGRFLKAIQSSKSPQASTNGPWIQLYQLYHQQGRTLERDHIKQQAEKAGLPWPSSSP